MYDIRNPDLVGVHENSDKADWGYRIIMLGIGGCFEFAAIDGVQPMRLLDAIKPVAAAVQEFLNARHPQIVQAGATLVQTSHR